MMPQKRLTGKEGIWLKPIWGREHIIAYGQRRSPQKKR